MSTRPTWEDNQYPPNWRHNITEVAAGDFTEEWVATLLNVAGHDGWELATIQPVQKADGLYMWLIMKKPIWNA
jgi:hypothetical protein